VQAIWDGIREGMGWILAFFYSIVPNVGFAIIMLTVLVRLILFPLTAKQAKSMIAMQRAQPEIKKLQAKYKNDRQKLNEELMKFYKEHQINPLGGCLPLLAQSPVFIALYQTLEEIQKFIPHPPQSLSQMYTDICSGGGNTLAKCTKPVLDFFGMNLAQSASNAPKGFGNALPYYILVGLVVISAFFQQRQTMRNQTQANPQMQIIGKIMPVVFGFISINIPAGVVLYFLTSNLWQIGQQEVVYRTIGTAAGPPKRKGDGKTGVIEAKSTERPTPAKGESTGGVKGIFKSLSTGAGASSTASDSPSENGKPASGGSPSTGAKQSGAAKGSGGAKSSGSTKDTGAAKGSGSKTTPPKGAPTASKKTSSTGQSANARRKNNRKRKR
jgi:YidC/Oxa1 family membrane protein insertase